MNNFPTVTVCTPTYNRFPFIPTLLEMFRNQDYPKSRLQWVIVDDGNYKIRNILQSAPDLLPNIKYISLEKKLSLGAKRNLMHKHADGDILVYMDDDDYYPPDRVSYAVSMLTSKPGILVSGSTELYMYFDHIKKMYKSGPFHSNHATAGTFAFKRELLSHTRYDDSDNIAEEKTFLKNYTIPLIQLDPLKTILVFPHDRNTFDKKKLMDIKNTIFSESDKTVDMWIKRPEEEKIKKFFLNVMQSKVNQIPV